MNHRWGDLINYTENISTLIIEIEKKTQLKNNCTLYRNYINVSGEKMGFTLRHKCRGKNTFSL